MSMRGGRRTAVVVSPRDFGWDRAVSATLRHSSLPWGEALNASPLAGGTFGSRDRLCLVAQYAAHQAALRFAGIADGAFDPAEWRVVQQRGRDPRLVRAAAMSCSAETAPPVLTLAQQFAEAVAAPALDVFRSSWARAEAVYIESVLRLRSDAAADLTNTRHSAAAFVVSPGPEALRTLAPGRHTYDDPACAAAFTGFGSRVFRVEGGSVIRYDALRSLRELIPDLDELREPMVVERIVQVCGNGVFIVGGELAIDGASRRVVQMLASAGGIILLVPNALPSLPPTRRFIVAPTLAALRAAEEHDVEALARSPEFFAFLECGRIPKYSDVPLQEPVRSYVAVLALLGDVVPRAAASELLEAFGVDAALEDLVVEGITTADATAFRFRDSASVARLVAPASRAAVCRIAAAVAERHGDRIRAAALFAEAGDFAIAADLLERCEWDDDRAVLESLERFSRRAMTPKLLVRLVCAVTSAGRYRDARELASSLEGDDREIALARIDRRCGDYATALTRLERVGRSPDADLIRAEVLSVLRRDDEARSILESSGADGDRAAFMRAIVTGARVEVASPYLNERLRVYDALARADVDEALAAARDALVAARCATESIDAHLDIVFTLFQAGRWPLARAAAIEALSEVEESQGDRAAGGLLFLLAYLAADDGQWEAAQHRIARLRQFYREARDERHYDEIELLTAHLDFCRGRFGPARRAAAALLERSNDAPIAEAAAAIIDEIDWIGNRPVTPRETPANVELRARHAMVRGGELPCEGPLPQRFRVALKRGDLGLVRVLAERAGITYEPAADPAEVELRILRALATADFPPPSHAIDVPWRYAVRNRLGHWSEAGSLPALGGRALDDVAADPGREWIACSDRELVAVDGCERWTTESRDAVAAAFRERAELQRLRRALEQQENAAPRTAGGAGMLGDSPAIHEVIDRISRVAPRDVAVCILGESGTGKELAARAIHRGSSRRQKPFTPVNCGALPDNLIESELFGHVRGAFTGADRDRAGLVETTDGGTLFLDEIGEMPLTAQAKLLRFLQDGEFRRVGESSVRSADVRIVTATNRKLDGAVEEGRFREDLYYRIRGVELTVPPLRDRGEDILLLAAHFLSVEREKHRSGPSHLSDEVEAIFLSYEWPGNVRELQNTIRGAHAIAGEAAEVAIEHLPERLRRVNVARRAAGSYQDAVARFRRDLIEGALEQVGGNQNRAASLLRMSRQALGYQIRELGILTERTQRRARL